MLLNFVLPYGKSNFVCKLVKNVGKINYIIFI